MSFELRKQLADLKAECEVLFAKRWAVLQSKKANAIELMKNETRSFLHSQGFTLSYEMTNLIEAHYKGSMKIKIQFSNPDDSFINADVIVDVDYLAQSFHFNVNLKRQIFDNVTEGDLSTEIAYYQKLVNQLVELDCTDIEGSVVITLIQKNLDKLTFLSMTDVLKFVLEM